MPRFFMSRFSLILVVGLLISGCTSSPWSSGETALTATSTPAAEQMAEVSVPGENSTHSDVSNLQEMMAELRQLGMLDPAAQDQLLEDLRQSDPSIWPLVMEQFRATQKYRHQAMERLVARQSARRLPTVDDISPTSMKPPEKSVEACVSPSNEVVQASYAIPRPGDWRQQLAGAIEALESEVAENPSSPVEVARQVRLRVLYAAAGRREEATRPISAAPAATQQFLSKEIEGLSTWLDVERTPDIICRTAETQPLLAEALLKLAESAPLVVRNLAFCTEVQSYGCIKRFDQYEFQPSQEVLLYAEVENFVSRPTPEGYHTSLRSSYRILDDNGACIAEHSFAPTEELCQNPRRDFFIGYHLRLPKDIKPGKHVLCLAIEDQQCQKVGQTAIEFSVGEAKTPDA